MSDLPHDRWTPVNSVQGSLERFGAQVAQRRVPSPAVVPAFDPFEDARSGLLSGSVTYRVHQLALEGAEEALDHRVVVTVARATHAALDAMGCEQCHGDAHQGGEDAPKAAMPTAETCQKCHKKQYDQYMAGKHSKGWVAMAAMPTNAIQPHPYISGLKGCGGCHRVGIKPEEEKKYNRYGMGCNACHTRHVFSKAEAAKPQACQTCHMGFDHPQWEMWSSSKHGSIALSTTDAGRAPVCQTCHMPGGDHGVKTAWGFLAVRLPEDDAEWMGYRATILKGLQVLDPDGKPTGRLEVVKAGDVARLTKEAFDAERNRMVEVCTKCHGAPFVKTNLGEADQMIKEADKLMAEAIEVVAGLYKDGILHPRTDSPAYPTYGMPYWWPFPFFGFSFLGLLALSHFLV